MADKTAPPNTTRLPRLVKKTVARRESNEFHRSLTCDIPQRRVVLGPVYKQPLTKRVRLRMSGREVMGSPSGLETPKGERLNKIEAAIEEIRDMAKGQEDVIRRVGSMEHSMKLILDKLAELGNSGDERKTKRLPSRGKNTAHRERTGLSRQGAAEESRTRTRASRMKRDESGRFISKNETISVETTPVVSTESSKEESTPETTSEREQVSPMDRREQARRVTVNSPQKNEPGLIDQPLTAFKKITSAPTFDGIKDNPKQYRDEMRRLKKLYGWDIKTAMDHVEYGMTDMAARWFAMTFTRKGRRKPSLTWEGYELAFENRFMGEKYTNRIMSEIFELRQSGDTVEHIKRVIQLIDSLGGDPMPEERVIELCYQGMDADARMHLRAAKPRTTQELIEDVTDYDKTIRAKGWKQNAPTSVNQPRQPSRPNQHQPKENEVDKRRPSWTILCESCGKNGHYSRGCKNPDPPNVIKARKEEWAKSKPWLPLIREYESQKTAGKIRSLRSTAGSPQGQRELPEPDFETDVFGLTNRMNFVGTILGREEATKLEHPTFTTDYSGQNKMAIKPIYLQRVNEKQRSLARQYVLVDNLRTEAVMDTGATVSIIPLELVRQLACKPYKWIHGLLTCADNMSVNPHSMVRLKVVFKDRSTEIDMAVLDRKCEILLGENYAWKSGLTLCYEDGFCGFKHEFCHRHCNSNQQSTAQTEAQSELNAATLYRVELVEQDWKRTGTSYPVRLREDTSIPPTSRVRVPIYIEGEVDASEIMLMEPTNDSIVRPIGGLVNTDSVIEVHNISGQTVKVMKGEKIARASALSAHEPEDYNNLVRVGGNLEPEQEAMIQELLTKYSTVFVTRDSEIGCIRGIEHSIDTGENPPIRSKPYRISIREQETVKKLIDEMLEAKIIRPSTSPWASPIVLVKKKDSDTPRFCIDYRRLNAITTPDPFPIPDMNQVIETLSENRWFSKLDVKAMYWHIRMAKDSREKTAFVVHCGQYEFNVMPFGLVSAPMTAMRMMSYVTRGFEKWCFIFYDDVLIFTETFKEHYECLELMFERLAIHSIKLSAKKCEICVNTVGYLGFVVSNKGIEPDPAKVKTIREFQSPTDITQARAFIGMCVFYRRFIKNFSAIAKPIHDCTKKNQKFVWTEQAEQAMGRLKELLASHPILVHFSPAGEHEVKCDASNYAIGAVLTQKHGSDELSGTVAYASKGLTPAQRNYSTTHKECLAVVFAVGEWRYFLYGRKFKIITDHHSLCWLKSLKDPTQRLMRWILILQEYQFDIVYSKGKLHVEADACSRLCNVSDIDLRQDEELLPDYISPAKGKPMVCFVQNEQHIDIDITELQRQDGYCQEIMNSLLNPKGKNKPRRWAKFHIWKGTLYRQSNSDPKKLLAVVPVAA